MFDIEIYLQPTERDGFVIQFQFQLNASTVGVQREIKQVPLATLRRE